MDRTEELKALTAGRSHFSTELPGMQIAWASTSLGDLKECPRKYYLSHVEQWRSKATALPLTFGLMYHSCLEWYDHCRAKGESHANATESVITKALHLTAVYGGLLGSEGGVPATGTFSAWETGDKRRSKESLIRSLVWYLEQFKDDPTTTVILADGTPAVELDFKMELNVTNPDGQQYLLCGHIDRMVFFNGDLYVQDRKTTVGALDDRFFERYTPDNQMSLYTMASKVVFAQEAKGVIIDAVQNTVGFSRFKRGFTMRTHAQNREWLADTEQWLKLAEGFAEAQHWPMNDKACHHYNGCQFLPICSKDPSTRGLFMKDSFEKLEWNPLVKRDGI